MNTTTFSDDADDYGDDPTPRHNRHHHDSEPSLPVQILSVIAFGAFSIVAISLAFHAHWIAGLVLAVVIAKTWAGSRTFGSQRDWSQWSQSWDCSFQDLAPKVSRKRSTGNSSFDAHRAETLERLEQENRDFEDFLTRLREASDATEFDQFMDDRAANARKSDASDEKPKGTKK